MSDRSFIATQFKRVGEENAALYRTLIRWIKVGVVISIICASISAYAWVRSSSANEAANSTARTAVVAEQEVSQSLANVSDTLARQRPVLEYMKCYDTRFAAMLTAIFAADDPATPEQLAVIRQSALALIAATGEGPGSCPELPTDGG